MRRKRIAVWVWLFLSVFLIASAKNPSQEEGLLRVFDRTGAKMDRHMLHAGSRASESVASEDLPGLAEQLAGELGLGAVHSKSMTDGMRYEADGKWNRNLQVEMVVINDRPEEALVQPYISIRAVGRGPLSQAHLDEARSRLFRTLQKFRIDTSTHFSIQGKLPVGHRVNRDDREKLVRQVVRELGAEEVESMRTERIISVSAHTPLFNGGLNTKGGTMNVQVAAKVGDDDRQIILTLGTPIITIEY
ncbi:YwmB family TATA-box binding protein [Kroppenstedtia eburnea]|uniref:TATA-box binding n=1 Tax=Kroppenstedtia eburnea TaxID=714067 RepID=A0A1N7JNT2_9BACL|nr:YwmB family TATA-box binding protein [Kroppenstedtia eburnea]EGK10711.1 hypothetical protein HMPREF9374_2371 [Desmospora sp. 8437]QKI83497.1 hypothetical protein GXN75_16775 [Kroppenstedtia eburnea]SIS50906.1 TATA-box binding [Kroppenstedtia eburnea]